MKPFRSFQALSVLLTFLLFVMPTQQLRAQEASSGINGVIADRSGGVIPHASVTVRNVSTNVKAVAKTNAEGYYEFPVLPAGDYVVTATAPGFSTAQSTTFNIETGNSSRINLQLQIGSEVTTVDVSSATTLLNTTTNEVGITVSQQEMENLPVQNRNLFDLIALQPGVNSSQSGDADSTSQNARGGFEVNGAPGLSNSILLDGVDATFGEDNGAGAGNQVAINTVGIGAIAEFRTSSSVPPVQYGRAAGGVLTITTKSGTNKVHGQIFEYFRNDVMDANTWANINAKPVPVARPELRFNEFGGNVGGPLLRNRTFYFMSYEGSRVIQGTSTTTSQIPSPFLIQKMATQTKTPNYQLITQELQMMPLPNSPAIPFDPANPTVNSGTHGNFAGNLNSNTFEDTGLGRIDTVIGKRHHLTVRANVNNQEQTVQQIRPDNQLIYPLRLYNSVISDAWTITPNVVNELRVGLNRNDLARHNTTFDTNVNKNFIVITGVAETDTAESQLHFLTTTYTIVDNLTWVHGRHTFTFGTDNRDLRSTRYQDTNTTTTFANTTAMYTNKPTSVGIYFGHTGHFLSWQTSVFAQDSFRASSRLTLNYGVRYEHYTPLIGAFNIANSDPFSAIRNDKWAPFFSENKYDFAPRLGLIGDVLGNGKLIFRAGFGLMFLPPQPFLLYNSAFVDPRLPSQATVTTADIRGANANLLQFPLQKEVINQWAADPSTLTVAPGRFVSDYHHPDQYSINWNANLQYEMRKDLYFSLTYTALRDEHSPTMTLPNNFAHGVCPVTGTNLSGGACGPRPNPNFAEIDYNIYAGREYYDGLYGQVTYRKGQNRANFYYTYASGISFWASNNNIGTGQSDIQDLDNPVGSRGPSTGSSRNRIAAAYTITPRTPGFARSRAALRGTFGGWSLQSIFKYNSGTVRNVVTTADLVRNGRTAGTRPDRVAGQSLYMKTTAADGFPLWLNPAAFDYKTPFAQQRYGNLGWNAVVGPINFNWNASVIKAFRFYHGKDLRLRIESFNVINHQNLGSPNLTVNNSNFGEITARRAPRTVQLGAELRF